MREAPRGATAKPKANEREPTHADEERKEKKLTRTEMKRPVIKEGKGWREPDVDNL